MAAQRKTPGTDEPGATFKQSKQHQFTYSPLVRQVAGGLLLLAIVAAGASIAYRTCRASRGTMAPALNRAGAENTISVEVAAPTVKRGFVMSESMACRGIPTAGRSGCGQDEPIRKDGCTATDVFSHPAHLMPLKTANGGFLKVPVGA